MTITGPATTATTASWVQPSPLGPLSVTTGPGGVRSVGFGAARFASAGTGQEPGPPDAAVADAFDAYFAGELRALDSLAVDLSGRTDFGRAVLVALRELGRGRLTSYGELAAAIGRPAAARAVGQAVGANPVPIVIPCHRVLATGGSLGGYSGGLDIKRRLLTHEGWPAQPTGAAATPTPSLPR